MTLFVAALIVVGGLVAGTISAWIAHSYVEDPEEEVAVWTPATCGDCTHTITAADIAPPRWWISHRARCPHCTARLDFSWLGVQLVVPALMLLMYATWGNSLVLIPFLWLVPVLVTAATTDVLLMLIPKKIAWVGAGVGATLIVIVSVALGSPSFITTAAIGGIGYFLFLFAVAIVSPAGMGMGDVRLALLLGLYLGWINIMLPVIGLLIACVVGLAMGVAVRAASKGAQRHFPFGPGLAAGTILAIAFSQPILDRLAS